MEDDDLRYARTTSGHQIAYRCCAGGTGTPTIYLPGFLYSLESLLDDPPYARFVEHMTAAAPLILLDRRGVGASDALEASPDAWEQWSEDVIAVADELGIERFMLVGYGSGGELGLHVALRRPDRVDAVVAMHPGLGVADTVREGFRDMTTRVVGREDENSTNAYHSVVPSRADEPAFVEWNQRAGRLSAGPRAAAAFWSAVLQPSRLRGRGDEIGARVLLLYRRGILERHGDRAEIDAFVAASPRAELRIIDGDDVVVNAGDVDQLSFEVLDFLHGEHSSIARPRLLRALLFTDIVGSTAAAADLGDDEWRRVLDHHDHAVARVLRRHGGALVKGTGDGVLAMFDAASRAVGAAWALRAEFGRLGLAVRMGVHVGEVEVRGDDLAGVAVHLAARIMGRADADEIAVSSAVELACLGSEWEFASIGTHDLDGFTAPIELLRVVGRRRHGTSAPT